MLSHLDSKNQPRMVDVGGKPPTVRTAHARAEVVLPPEVARLLEAGEIRSAKGPVFHTAILAGIGAAKRTAELIPLCHILPLEDCQVSIEAGPPQGDGSAVARIDCRARATAKTGVEMEALTGASVAALTLYDMVKGVTHAVTIRSVRLLEKTGGKSDFRAAE